MEVLYEQRRIDHRVHNNGRSHEQFDRGRRICIRSRKAGMRKRGTTETAARFS